MNLLDFTNHNVGLFLHQSVDWISLLLYQFSLVAPLINTVVYAPSLFHMLAQTIDHPQTHPKTCAV